MLQPGSRLGRYEIRSLIGAGGMGEVYLAHDGQLQRPVALKVLSAAVRDGRGSAQAAGVRGARGVGAQSSEHPHGLRRRADRRGAFHRHGVRRRRDAAAADDRARSRRSRETCSTSPCRSPRRWRPRRPRGWCIATSSRTTSCCARDGYVKLLDFGLARTAAEPDARREEDRSVRRARHRLLHVARAVARTAARHAQRHLEHRRDAVRADQRTPAVRGRQLRPTSPPASCAASPRR